ncbi:MAG: metallophosphoesterase, partial [Clostridia bacterium]|nr:metallophosphoesterase [Clostridia bacterium]
MRFRVIFTADIHGYLFPTDYCTDDDKAMGLLKLLPAFERDENTLLLDGGDTIQGSPFTSWAHRTEARPHPCALLLNHAGYDYVTIGNHDVDYGTAFLGAYLNELKAKCVSANLRDREGKLPVLSSVIHTLPNGVRVGITGVCTQQLMRWEKKDLLDTLVIEDPVLRAAQELKALKSRCDFTVCIYHGGFSVDPVSGRRLSEWLENQGEEICALGYDLVLCGHQHRSMAGLQLGASYAVQVASKGVECCILDMEGNPGAWRITSRLIPVSREMDAEGEALLREDERALQAWLDLPAGHLTNDIPTMGHLECAYLGSPFANLLNAVQA